MTAIDRQQSGSRLIDPGTAKPANPLPWMAIFTTTNTSTQKVNTANTPSARHIVPDRRKGLQC